MRRALSVVCTLQLGLIALSSAVPHGDEHGSSGLMHGGGSNKTANIEWSESFDVPNYFRHPNQSIWVYTHIISMIIAWAGLLPLGEYLLSMVPV